MSVIEENLNGLKLTPRAEDARASSDFTPQSVKPFKIRDIEIYPPLVLSPMAGV